MARIPENEIERLKSEISIQRLAESAGIELKRHGKDLLGHCPFHDDKTPSLVITPAKNLWHCLGACQTGGTVIDWVMKREGISFRHAVERLQTESFSLAAPDKSPARSRAPKLAVPFTPDAGDTDLMHTVIDFHAFMVNVKT